MLKVKGQKSDTPCKHKLKQSWNGYKNNQVKFQTKEYYEG